MSEKDAYIKQLENTIIDLQNQINNLTEMILLLRKEKFEPKSEKPPQMDGQLSLFNEAEVEARLDEEPIIERKGSLYRRNRKTSRKELLKDLPVEEVPCIIHPNDMYCDRCGTTLKEIGFVKVRDELEYVPAQVKIIRYMQQACECPKCKHKGIPFIKKAFTPKSVLNHSLASPSSVARVMYHKYVNGMPLYRQEKDWEQIGIGLSRSTMANWIIRSSKDHLMPVVEHLRKELLKRDIIHLRRKFVEAIPAKKSADGTPTSAQIGRQYCDKLFAIEDSLKDLTSEERFCKRLELEKPVLEAFWCWLDSVNVLKGSALGKAVNYAQNQKPYMENYLLGGDVLCQTMQLRMPSVPLQ